MSTPARPSQSSTGTGRSSRGSRRSFLEQMGPSVVCFAQEVTGEDYAAAARRRSTISTVALAAEIDTIAQDVTTPFVSKFAPGDMRQLALVAHNHMKPAMKEFITTYSDVLKKFRITGTQTTMRMCKTLWGEDDPDIEYGLTCTSGPLGGDAQIAALMCMEDLGALIFFVDPLSAHPHQADIDSLIRLSNCGNVIVCPNPTSAMSMMHTLRTALVLGSRGMIPSFFETLESPAVDEYKRQQELALAAAVAGRPVAASDKPALNTDASFFHPNTASDDDDDDDSEYDSDEGYDEFLSSLQEGQSNVKPEKKVRSSSSNLYGIKAAKPKKNSMTKKIRKLTTSLSKKVLKV